MTLPTLTRTPSIALQLTHELEQRTSQVERLKQSLEEADKKSRQLQIAIDQLALANADLDAKLRLARAVLDAARAYVADDPRSRLATAITEFDALDQPPVRTELPTFSPQAVGV